MSKIAKKTVEIIIEDLTDRRGLRHEWEQIDDDIRREIKTTWIEIVDERFSFLKGLTDPEKQIKLLVILSQDLINLSRQDTKLSEQDFIDELRRRLENLESAIKPFKGIIE